MDAGLSPAGRPLLTHSRAAIETAFADAIAHKDGLRGAHCLHELWMRGEFSQNIQPSLSLLWDVATATIPDWLPMQYVEWLPIAYEVAGRFSAKRRGRMNIYLILLDYRDRRDEPYGEPFGVYVGMSRYPPAERFDQHKAGIRSAGVVLKRGLEVLFGPTQHLQGIPRSDAAEIEVALGEALTAAGLFVKGGH